MHAQQSATDAARKRKKSRDHVVPGRDVHGDGDDGNPADSAGIPRVWKAVCGVPAGMEVNAAGIPRGLKKLHGIPADLIYLLQSYLPRRCTSLSARRYAVLLRKPTGDMLKTVKGGL